MGTEGNCYSTLYRPLRATAFVDSAILSRSGIVLTPASSHLPIMLFNRKTVFERPLVLLGLPGNALCYHLRHRVFLKHAL